MVPKLRFKEFCGEWEEKRLGEIMYSFDYGMNSAAIEYDGKNKYIRITDIDENSHKYINKNRVSPSGKLEDKYIVRKNDILFARTGASTGKTYLYNENDGSLYFAGFLIRGNVKKEYNSYFVFSQTLTDKYNKWVALTSIRSGQPGINSNEYSGYKIKVPSLSEQTKIGDFLSTVDDKIQNQQDKITHLENIKKGFMQRIFSRKIRFKDDGGEEFSEWKEKRIGKIYIDRNEKPNKKMELLSVTINNGVIKRSDIEGKDNSSEDKSNYKVVYKGDMVYNSMRMWQGASGISSYDGIVSPAYTVMKNKVDINNIFFAYLFKQPELIFKFRRFSQGLTSDTWNLKYPQIKEIKIKIPCLKEQQKIADFLSAFDEKIDIEKETLEHLKQLKKGLLQRMFV